MKTVHESTPRLKDVKNAWCRERAPYLEDYGLPAWTIAKRQFDRLIEQIRADAYARGKADAQQLTGESSYSYQDGPIPPGTMTARELAETEDD